MTRAVLNEKDMPRQWYNLNADCPPKNPPLGPDGKPLTPEALTALLPMSLVGQIVSPQRWIDIPEEVLELYSLYRPTPLHRARFLEKELDTPARIYYKNESISPSGSFKPNTAIAQAWYNKQDGTRRIVADTAAGQWGSGLAFACALLGLECKVFMVRVSYDQKPYRKLLMRTWGADCVASPSNETQIGRDTLAENPDNPGSAAVAVSEAMETVLSDESGTSKLGIGSGLEFVMLHQTIIGLEAKKQLHIMGEKKTDMIIACAGAGSNFSGIAFPFVQEKLDGAEIELIPVEPAACPSMTRGAYRYDFLDAAESGPLVPMYTLGHDFVPPPIHAGGLRFHGMAPMVSQGVAAGLFKPRAVHQLECYEAAVLFARTEGIVPAPEASHAIAATIQEAKKAKEEGKERVILFNLSGHGLLDLSGYDSFLKGEIEDYSLPQEYLEKSLNDIAEFPVPAV